ncbi:MAG: hypothetical protein JSW66_11265 [Phycisphaerales bacterium]|nr:MAG: hypothetical protein JSW66_11265 [Phycisphaerales bacterium]
MRSKSDVAFTFIFVALLCLVPGSVCSAVSSKVTRHTSSSDLLKGKAEQIVIGSRGTIQLGRSAESVIKEFKGFADVWSVNSVVLSGGTIYFGTSPNGGIYKYSLNKVTKIYPQETDRSESKDEEANRGEADGEVVKAEERLSNEHIFAMATDVAGRLLAGISGKECKLCRFEGGRMEVLFEPTDANYIFAIAIDDGGSIFLGTGPEGKIYRLDSLGRKSELVYDSRDKNILSLAVGRDGWIFAGSDSRGLVYKINPRTKQTMVLYDSDQPEVTALLSSGNSSSGPGLYAAATSAKMVQAQAQFAASTLAQPSPGRPETETEKDESPSGAQSGLKLEIPNTETPKPAKPTQAPAPARKPPKPTQASHIYRITEEGFVTDIFSETAVFFCLAEQDDKLLVGTGNSAELYSVDPASEQEAVVYEDEQASQITAIAVSGDDVYIGTANPAKLIKLGSGFASEGTYISDLIDAGQPANWGKLQLEAEIPQGCKVLLCARSGNVKDVNDPTFSDWSDPVEITEPVQLSCPLGRFCQYKLVLQSPAGVESPLIREIAVASTVPNLAPRVASVAVARIAGTGKQGAFKIGYAAKDDNGDKLVYRIDFRRLGRTSWIELKDELEASSFEWNGKTVEDGRYEIRITASDERSNTTSTKLTGSRVSEPVVVDNAGPIVRDMKMTSARKDDRQLRVFEIEVSDELSAIAKLEYTIDSHADWTGTVPEDLVYDTTQENFIIRIDVKDDLPTGDHVLTVRVSDAVGNTTYKTFDVNVD